MRLQGLGRVEVVAVAASPAKRVSIRSLQATEIHAALFQRLELFDGVIGSDDADDAHLGKKTR